MGTYIPKQNPRSYRKSGKPEVPLADKIKLVKATKAFKEREPFSMELMSNLTKLSHSAIATTLREMHTSNLITRDEVSTGCYGTKCLWTALPPSPLRQAWRSGQWTNAQAGRRNLARLGVEA